MEYVQSQIERFESMMNQFREDLKDLKKHDERIAKLEATIDNMCEDIREIKETVSRVSDMLVDRVQANGRQDGLLEALTDRLDHLETGLKTTSQRLWTALFAGITALLNGIMLWIFGR